MFGEKGNRREMSRLPDGCHFGRFRHIQLRPFSPFRFAGKDCGPDIAERTTATGEREKGAAGQKAAAAAAAAEATTTSSK